VVAVDQLRGGLDPLPEEEGVVGLVFFAALLPEAASSAFSSGLSSPASGSGALPIAEVFIE
jgi:hypothetical protein